MTMLPLVEEITPGSLVRPAFDNESVYLYSDNPFATRGNEMPETLRSPSTARFVLWRKTEIGVVLEVEQHWALILTHGGCGWISVWNLRAVEQDN